MPSSVHNLVTQGSTVFVHNPYPLNEVLEKHWSKSSERPEWVPDWVPGGGDRWSRRNGGDPGWKWYERVGRRSEFAVWSQHGAHGRVGEH